MISELLIEYISVTDLGGLVFNKMFLLQAFVTLLVYSFINIILYYRIRHKRHLLLNTYGISGPKPSLLDGSLQEFRENPSGYEVYLKYYKSYGRTFGFYIGDEANIVTIDLEKLRKIFLERSRSFTERSVPFIDTPMSDGILFARYHRWKLFRKLMSPYFNSRTVRGAASTMFIEDSISLMIEYIEKRSGGKQQVILDIHDLMKATALHMISSMAIQLPDVQVREKDDYVQSLDAFLTGSDKGAVILATQFPFLQRVFAFLAAHLEHGKTMALIRRGINDYIKKSHNRYGVQRDEEQSRLIDLLVRMYHEGKISYKEVIGNAEAILFAGYDTTSTTLTYVFWVLGKHPEIQEKLRHELMAHGVDSEYLEQVLMETMRLYPTVFSFTSRLATETVMIDEELTIPEGARVIYISWLLYRNPDIWPNPEQFDPERFRKGVEHHPCAFAPFGLGERKCLGYQLAKLEMKMITCDVLLRYRIKLISPENLELVTYATVLSKPKEKVVLALEKL